MALLGLLALAALAGGMLTIMIGGRRKRRSLLEAESKGGGRLSSLASLGLMGLYSSIFLLNSLYFRIGNGCFLELRLLYMAWGL